MNKRYTVVVYNIDGTHKEIYQTQQFARAFGKAIEINLTTQKSVIYEIIEHIKWHGAEMDYEGTYMEPTQEWGNKEIPTLRKSTIL